MALQCSVDVNPHHLQEVETRGQDVNPIFTKSAITRSISVTARAYAQRVALQLPPRRAAKTVKMPTISRAEGGQLQAPVGRRGLEQIGL